MSNLYPGDQVNPQEAGRLLKEQASRLQGNATRALHHTSDEGLLKAFAVLTHRLHAVDRKKGPEAAVLAMDLRQQRNRVEEEILKRMRKE